MRRRPHMIVVRLDDKELAHLQGLVAVSGKKREALLRDIIMGRELRPRPPEEFASLLHQLAGMANNLNQLSRTVNASKAPASATQVAQALELARDAWRLVRETL